VLAGAADETDADDTTGRMTDAEINHAGDEEPGSPVDEAAHEEAQPPEAFSDEQLKAVHAKIDKNADGKMSMDEIMEFWKVTRKSMAITGVEDQLEVLDHNKDGKVTLEEYTMEGQGEVEDAPAKHPSFITPPGEAEAAKGQPSNAARRDAEQAREQALRDMEEAKFKLADANSDGSLDRTELSHLSHPEAHDGMLDILSAHTLKMKDTNGDGELSPDEFWDTAGTEPMEAEDWQDHLKDFQRVDLDASGKLNVKEISDWEGGAFHTRQAFQELMEIVDDDKDGHLTMEELNKHDADIASTDALMHFNEWSEHHEL